MMGLVFKWLIKNGGTDGMERMNQIKSNMVYDFIDQSSGFYV